MPRFKQPPHNWREILVAARRDAPEQLDALAPHAQITDERGEYLAYDRFLYLPPPRSREEKTLLWSLIKERREPVLRTMFPALTYSAPLRYYLSDTILEACSLVDRMATDSALQGTFPDVAEFERFNFLFEDLEREEAIGSSQLEGAATTRIVAQQMLLDVRSPKTSSERMIVGNYRMVREAWAKRDTPLTVELIQSLHRTGTHGIEDDTYAPGLFRTTNDVVVADGSSFTVHTPPSAEQVLQRLEAVCDWFNQPSPRYTHPLLRAITLHFLLSHEHPFNDGNGRVARALFYWAMFKAGYPVMRYVSISLHLKEAHAQYGTSFRRVQSDEFDLTYFLDLQSDVIRRSLLSLYEHLGDARARMQAKREVWSTLPEYHALNEREQHILEIALLGVARSFRSADISRNFKVSTNTALSDLNTLADAGFLRKEKQGREWIYTFEGA